MPAAVLVDRRVEALAAGRVAGADVVAGAMVAADAVPPTGTFDLVARRLLPRRREVTYERELPVVLESVASQLRAGASVAQAIAGVDVEPSRCDLPEHWARLTRLVPVLGVDAALADWAEADGAVPSVRLAAGALALAATTGGSAARAVDGVASTLRSRLAVSEEVRALSSQARMSAAVIAGAPLVFLAIAAATDRRIVDFFTSPLGVGVFVAGVALDALGAWWMHRLCRVPA